MSSGLLPADQNSILQADQSVSNGQCICQSPTAITDIAKPESHPCFSLGMRLLVSDLFAN